MEQINNNLPFKEDGNNPAKVKEPSQSLTSPLLPKVRQNFGFFGAISLTFGVVFAFLFYQAGMGLNMFVFIVTIIILLLLIMKKLNVRIKGATYGYYLGAAMLGLSSTLTSSGILQFINLVGILLLLDVSLLHQFHKDKEWEFGTYIGKVFWLILICIDKLGRPFIDSFHFLNNSKVFKSKRVRNNVIGALIALPLLWVIAFLLSQADYMFRKLTDSSIQFLFSPNIVGVSVMIVAGFIACYCIICGAVDKTIQQDSIRTAKKADPGIATTAMSLILVVYIIFCFIQLMYLFTNGVFTLPQEYTYAEYARRGFFELLAVTGINIILMIACGMLFDESRSLRIVLTGITICTYIMIASAAYRMLLYINVYHLTFLRLFVLLFLLIDALLLAGIIIAQYQKKFPLFPYCVLVISICYITFSYARPDYHIASYQIKHVDQLSTDDMHYLTKVLSLDAAPAVLPFLSDSNNEYRLSDSHRELGIYDESKDIVNQYYDRIERVKDRQGNRDFNYSNYQAIKLFERLK